MHFAVLEMFKKLLKNLLKPYLSVFFLMSTDAKSLTDWGRAFHSNAAATAKERPP